MPGDSDATDGDVHLRGQLSGDSIEGSGLFLLQPGGRRVELLLPRGMTIPDRGGDAILDVSGRFAPEVASFRQQGPRFRVSAIAQAPDL